MPDRATSLNDQSGRRYQDDRSPLHEVVKPSPKITAAALAGAVATIIWTIVATFSPGVFSETAIATLTGSTTTIVAALLAYLRVDASSE